MAIKKVDGGWLVDFRLGGRGGKRYRKTFKVSEGCRKIDAQRWLDAIKGEAARNSSYVLPAEDRRRLKDLVERWYVVHGLTLKSGRSRRQRLFRISETLENPVVSSMSSHWFGDYRAKRLASGISPNTVNHDLAYVRALFRELIRLGEWLGPNPVATIRKLKVDERELSYLSLGQIEQLLAALEDSRNPDVVKIARVCLATGARWTEAECLRSEQVKRCRIEFWNTKNGRLRSVPISEEFFQYLSPGRPGRLFQSGYRAFANAVSRCRIDLPDGQMTHVLRHTFASHFMMNGGDILVLQKILGHGSLSMTMRYAHLSPDHLEQAVRFNPLSCMRGHFVDASVITSD